MKKLEERIPKGFDALTTAAQAIGSTLGKIAVKTGLAKPAPPIAKKRVAPRRQAVKAAEPTKRKTAVRKAGAKTAMSAKKRS
jgi:hypothetical protein